MSFDKSDAALRNMNDGSSEKNSTTAMVEAMKTVTETITKAEKAMVIMAANPISNNLNELNKNSETTNENINNLTSEITDFRESLDNLNINLIKFDEQATKLGRTANILALVLAVTAIVQTGATLWQIFCN